jgi:hypothetical protein
MLILAHAATDTPVWAVFAATTALAFFAWLSLGQIRQIKADRHIQFLSDYGRRWDEQSLVEARKKQTETPNDELIRLVEEWFEPGVPKPRDSPVPLLLRIPNFFEDMAIAVEAGNVDPKFVVRQFGFIIEDMWKYWSTAIHEMRKHTPRAYIEFEALASDVARYRASPLSDP